MFFRHPVEQSTRLIRVFSGLCLAPGIAAWILERAFAAMVSIEDSMLVLQDRWQRVEIRATAIDRVTPWMIPLPSSGVWVRLKSGRRFRYELQVSDPIAVIEALADAGAPEHVRTAGAASGSHLRTMEAQRVATMNHPALKFLVFALVPTLPLFRLHQWVAYGATFGEYYTYGLTAYLLAFALLGDVPIYLVLYAAALRAVAETVAFVVAYLAPSHAATARRTVEIADGILYYGGVPVLLILMFLR